MMTPITDKKNKAFYFIDSFVKTYMLNYGGQIRLRLIQAHVHCTYDIV